MMLHTPTIAMTSAPICPTKIRLIVPDAVIVANDKIDGSASARIVFQ